MKFSAEQHAAEGQSLRLVPLDGLTSRGPQQCAEKLELFPKFLVPNIQLPQEEMLSVYYRGF